MPKDVLYSTPPKEPQVNIEAVKGLFQFANMTADNFFEIVQRMFDVAKTNPLWGGILGIIVIDIMGHKVNFINWTHKELFYPPSNSFLSHFDVQVGYTLGISQTNPDPKQSQMYMLDRSKIQELDVDGILTRAAIIQIISLILSAFVIAEAGSIITDITSIFGLGGTKSTTSLVTPSVNTLVEKSTGQVSPIVGVK